jgi:glutathione S-transferase
MDLKLYVIPGSHPCASVEAALNLKRLAYERVDLIPGLSPILQMARFGRRTVPGLVVDGNRVSGSKLIMRALDGLEPEPPLYSGDPAADEAERWGDDELQSAARWIVVYGLGKNPAAADSYTAGANIPQFPPAVAAAATRAVFATELRVLGDGPEGARRALQGLPGLLDHVDELIEAGTIGAETPNAADLQIAGSVRLLLTMADLREEIDARPAGRLARRLIPRYPGDLPAGSLPADWVPALGSASPATVPA